MLCVAQYVTIEKVSLRVIASLIGVLCSSLIWPAGSNLRTCIKVKFSWAKKWGPKRPPSIEPFMAMMNWSQMDQMPPSPTPIGQCKGGVLQCLFFKFQFQKYNQHWPTLFKMCWIFWQLNVPESKLNTFSMFSRDWAASRQESIWSINKQLVHSWHWICARVVLHPKCSEQTRLKIRSFHCLVRFKIGQFVGALAMLLAVAAVYFTTDSQTQTQLGTELEHVEHVEPEKSTDLDPVDSRPVIYFDSDEYVVPSTCLTAMLRLASTNALAGGWGSQNWTTWGGNQTAFHSHPEISTRNQKVNSIHGLSWPA